MMIKDTFPFNQEKSINSLLYIASKLTRKDFHKIFKILYFSDREHIARYGSPITGDVYIAMDAGPVPSKIYDILKIVRGDSYIKDNTNLQRYFSVENWMYVSPKVSADLMQLSKSDIECIDACIERYGNLSYDEIKEKSHDIAWRSTAKDYAISTENIAREAGLDAEECEYVIENCKIANSINSCKD